MDWITPAITGITVLGSLWSIVWFIQKQTRQFTLEVRKVRDEFRDERMEELERRLDRIEGQISGLEEFNERIDKFLTQTESFNRGRNFEAQQRKPDRTTSV